MKNEKLKEYKEAYYYLLNFWDSFNHEQHEEINRELNKIFKLNKEEKVKLK